MSGLIERSSHSNLPEGPGSTSGFASHVDSQRDLWRFLLPYSHLQAAALRGGGVVNGLHVSGTVDSLVLTVAPGLALDAGGRLLVVAPSVNNDLRVRLRRTATADVGTEGLVPVSEKGVELPTAGLGGVQYVVLEWNETRLTLDEGAVYRLTPWLHLEARPTDQARQWAVLARVTLGTGDELGRVKALDAGPRQALTSLRDGLAFNRSLVDGDDGAAPAHLRVHQASAAGLRGRTDGGLDIGSWAGPSSTWQAALSIDGSAGKVGIGIDPGEAAGLLDVAGLLHAVSMDTGDLKAAAIDAGDVQATTVTTTNLTATTVATGGMNATTVDAGNVKAASVEAGDMKATSIDTTGLKASTVNAGDVTAANLNTTGLKAATVDAGDLKATNAQVEALQAGTIQHGSQTMPIIRGGSTDPATTPWQQYSDVNCVFVVVDTSSAGFTKTPLYFSSLGGNGSQFLVTGENAIYSPTPTSFTLYLRTPVMNAAQWSLSPGWVQGRGWFINWVGVQLP